MKSNEVFAQVQNLGICKGDSIYLRLGLKNIGRIDNQSPIKFAEILEGIIGPQGNIVTPAFTKIERIGRFDIEPLIRETPTNCGAYARRLLSRKDAQRSNHPTHSFVGIGPQIKDFFATHEPYSTCFQPLRPMMEVGSKMLLVGCLVESPGFSTIHLAQYDLGLTQKHLIKFLVHAAVSDGKGGKKVYRLPESPGCSMGFDKHYKYYLNAGILKVGKIGLADALLIDMKKAYELDMAALKISTNSPFCDRPHCLSCRALNGYNLTAAPRAWASLAARKIKTIITHND